jgi:protein ImuA
MRARPQAAERKEEICPARNPAHDPASHSRVVHLTFLFLSQHRRREKRVAKGRAETEEVLAELRAAVARIERRGATAAPAAGAVLPFGRAALDARLPDGGLALGALHEVAGSGPDVEHGAAAALFVAGVLARLPGLVLWALERRDLFAPALAGVGVHPDRVIYAEAGRPTGVLLVMEEGLRHPGLAGVVGEVSGRLTLTASRRLQLAAEASGVVAFVLRHSRRHADPALAEPSAAVARWRVGALPSPPPLPHTPDVPGLGRARWRLDLVRCRGAEPRSWIVEACDAQGGLGMAADLADGQAASARRPRRAAG